MKSFKEFNYSWDLDKEADPLDINLFRLSKLLGRTITELKAMKSLPVIVMSGKHGTLIKFGKGIHTTYEIV